MALPVEQIGWIATAQEGDVLAFNKLVQVWYPRIYNFGFAYFGKNNQRESKEDLAHEIAQKTFIKVFEKLPTLSDPEKFRPWLYRIASNYCHEELRRNKLNRFIRLNPLGKEEEPEFQWKDESPLADTQTQIKQQAFYVRKAINTLKPEQREVVIMKEFEGLKFREIAEVLSIPENTAKARLYYGLKHLRKTLEKWNFQEQVRYES